MKKPIDCASQKGIRYRVNQKDKILFLSLEDVSHMVCDSYLTTIYLIDGRNVSVTKLLKKFEEELKDFGFVRANRNVLVNLIHVDCIHIGKGERKLFVNGVSINISRRNLYKFK